MVSHNKGIGFDALVLTFYCSKDFDEYGFGDIVETVDWSTIQPDSMVLTYEF